MKTILALGSLIFAAALPTAADDLSNVMALMQEKRWDDARIMWEQMLASTPNYGYGHTQLGICRMELQDYVQAEIAFDNAVKQLTLDNQLIYLPEARIGLGRARLARDPCAGVKKCNRERHAPPCACWRWKAHHALRRGAESSARN